MSQVTHVCTVCDGPHDRKVDTCSTACTRWHRLYPGRKAVRACLRCGACIRHRALVSTFCSHTCAHAVGDARRRGGNFVVPRAFCLSCGGPLVGRTARAAYCSRACQAVRQKERRASKIAGAPVERVHPIDIYERDGWMCHLCSGPIDPQLVDRYDPERVSLDHIVAVAAPDFPGHVWENLAAAHLRCNIVKGDTVTARDRALHRRLAEQRLAPGGLTW